MSTKGLPVVERAAAEWLVTNKPKAAIETLIEQAEEIASLQRERDAAYQAGLEAGAKDDLACLAELRKVIASDMFAITFQSLGQYRSALLKSIDAAMKKEHP